MVRHNWNLTTRQVVPCTEKSEWSPAVLGHLMLPLQTSVSQRHLYKHPVSQRATKFLNWGFCQSPFLSLSSIVMEDIDMESIGHGGTSSRCCFCLPSSWSRTFQNDERWWSRGIRALYKLREWSEIVAGPRWKTFIRRFNRSRSIGRGACASNHGKFQYDPLSYALNFDEGPVDEDDEVVGFRNFSVRYASFHQPAKSGGLTESGTDVAVYR